MKERNFKFRESYAKVIKSMTDKQAGELIKSVCGYVFEDKPFETKDELLKGIYIFMQNALDTERESVKNGKVGAVIGNERKKEQRLINAASVAASATSVIIAVEKTAKETPTGKTQEKNQRSNPQNRKI